MQTKRSAPFKIRFGIDRAFLARWLGLSLLFHLIAAWFSIGYHDVDEHFQILEFLNSRLGLSSPSELAWEHAHRIRPWLQPMFYEAIIRPLRAAGVQDPFQWATVLRVVSALIGWGSVAALCLVCAGWFKERRWREWAVRLSCLSFFVPYLHARTSSENLSGSLFLLAICWHALLPRLRLKPSLSFFGVGALLGLSFICRYQVAFGVLGFGLWLVTSGKVRDGRLLTLAGGFIAAVAAGLGLDAWGYGEWTWTPWNYFYENLIVGRAAGFGTSPFWFYAEDLWKTLPPLGALLLSGALLAWVLRPGQVLSLTSLAFFLGHSLISHKEPRFLYPIAAQMPLVALLGYERLSELAPIVRKLLGIGAGLAVAMIALAVNTGALLLMSFKPAQAQIGWYAAVYRHDPEIREIYLRGLDPYVPAHVRINYYRRPELKEHEVASYDEILRALSPVHDLWFFHENYEIEGDAAVLKPYCKLEYTTFPKWLEHFTFLPGPRKFANRWSLHRCRAAALNPSAR